MGNEFWAVHLIWLAFVFIFGTSVGSFLNVCIARLPLEKSILWPRSRCMTCLQPIRKWDNLPIIGYLRLRGRCRTCGARFSSRYLWVELFTGLVWAAIFYVDVLHHIHGNPYFKEVAWEINAGAIPFKAWIYFLHHAVFVSFLIVAAACDLDGRVIPLTVTVPGILIGLLSATLHPWPWPNDLRHVQAVLREPDWANFLRQPVDIPRGLYAWPVWGPLPNWLPAGSWQLGLVTGLAGALVGMFMLRGLKFVFDRGFGKEALGLGDADLMMMAGAFLGWQPIVIAFFVGSMAALLIAIPMVLRGGGRALPFGPGLAIGLVITWLGWSVIGPRIQHFFFDWLPIVVVSVFVAGLGFGLSLLFRTGSTSTPPTQTAAVGK
jgi:leader peptidase (prepilin peptidase)/N-methyltransferase